MAQAGLNWANVDTEGQRFKLQVEVAKLQISLENNASQMAKVWPGRSVILCDRGILDGRAYTTEDSDEFERVVAALGMGNEDELRDNRCESFIQTLVKNDSKRATQSLQSNFLQCSYGSRQTTKSYC